MNHGPTEVLWHLVVENQPGGDMIIYLRVFITHKLVNNSTSQQQLKSSSTW